MREGKSTVWLLMKYKISLLSYRFANVSARKRRKGEEGLESGVTPAQRNSTKLH